MSNANCETATIRHIVFFSSKEPGDVDRIAKGLSMLSEIPYCRHFEVAKNLNKDRFSNDVDVVVYAEFESEQDMQAYRTHPLYDECISIVRPLREMRVAADFRSDLAGVPRGALKEDPSKIEDRSGC